MKIAVKTSPAIIATFPVSFSSPLPVFVRWVPLGCTASVVTGAVVEVEAVVVVVEDVVVVVVEDVVVVEELDVLSESSVVSSWAKSE